MSLNSIVKKCPPHQLIVWEQVKKSPFFIILLLSIYLQKWKKNKNLWLSIFFDTEPTILKSFPTTKLELTFNLHWNETVKHSNNYYDIQWYDEKHYDNIFGESVTKWTP
jgi:hypothetical protein